MFLIPFLSIGGNVETCNAAEAEPLYLGENADYPQSIRYTYRVTWNVGASSIASHSLI